MRRLPWRDGWAALALAAVVAALFKDILFRGHALCERDIYSMVYPQLASFAHCIFAGSWPVWDPYVGFGQPMLANPGAQVLYPWTWLALLSSPEPYYTAYVTIHLFFSGIGTYALSRRLGLSGGGSLTAAALWIGSGPLLSCVSLWQHLAGAAWIPWVLLAADTALRAPSLAHALLLGGALSGQILAGSIELVGMSGLFVTCYSVRYIRWTTDPENLRRIGAGALAVAFALAFTAAQWFPAFELLRGSSRSTLDRATRTYWSVHPLTLIQGLLPVFPVALPLKRELRTLLFQGRAPFLTSLYLGLVALPLVAAALWASPRRRLVAFLGGAGGAAVLVALGRYTVFYDTAVAILPPLGLFRYPAKAMILAGFCWALLGGLGYEACRAGLRARTSAWIASFPLAGAALAGLVLLALRFRGNALFALYLEQPAPPFADALAFFREHLVWASVLGVVAAAVVLLARGSHRSGGGAAALAMLAVLDLVRAHHDMPSALPRELLSRPLACIEVIQHRHLARFFAFPEYMFGKIDWPSLPDPVGRPAFPAYRLCMAANRWGLCGSYDLDPLHLYPRYLLDLNYVFAASGNTPAFDRLLRIGAVSYVFSLHKEGLERLTPVEPLPEPTRVYWVPETLPRAYVVGGARVAADLDALRLLIDPGFDFRREVVLPSGTATSPDPAFSGDSPIEAFVPDRVRIQARLNRPGYVVLVEAYDPQWRVTVDGREAPLLRANVAFRAVAVPAGTHVVEMTYRPRSLRLGLTVSAAALVLGLGLSIRSRLSRVKSG